MIFSAGSDGRMLSYDLAKDKVIPLKGNRPISAAAVAIDRMSFFIANENSATIYQFDIFGKLLKTFSGHTNDVTDLLVTVDRKHLISSSKDKTVRIWDIANATETNLWKDHTRAVTDIDMDAFGKHLVSGGLDGMVYLYDVKTNEKIASYDLTGSMVNAIALSPSNTKIVAATHIENEADSSGYFTLPTTLKARKVVLPKKMVITKIAKKTKSEIAKKKAAKKEKNKTSKSSSPTQIEQVKITIEDTKK